jgi:cytochrome oxidase Cu insertion factor (SCO1/SenC/PrrC family)
LIGGLASTMARDTTAQRRFRGFKVVAILLVFVGAISIVLATGINGYAKMENYLPEISLTDQNSRPVSLSSLRGKPVLVGFIHTMCNGVCQMMTANMRAVASALPPSKAANVTMLLITTDPGDDRPTQLLQYARDQRLSGKEWMLVTGSKDGIKRVMRLYGVRHEESDDAMMHVMKVFLVSPDGKLAHIYPGMKLSPQTVASDIEALSVPISIPASEKSAAVQ